MEDGSAWAVAGLCLVLVVVVLALARAWRTRAARRARHWKPRLPNDAALFACLETTARRHQQPAMAAALVHGDEILSRAAVGWTVLGDGRRVDLGSRFHLGSTTKGLTALLIAILVREGRLRYDSELGTALAEVPMRDEYKRVNVRDLLVHRAGVMAMQDEKQEDPAAATALWSRLPAEVPEPPRQRLEMARLVLKAPPIAPPGSKHIYSNVGFAVLGLLAETVAGESYETLVERRIFAPLGMTTARLGGWPASAAEPDQTRGHYVESGELRAQPLDDEYVLPSWMNPAGGAHCSIEDYARYARETLHGLRSRGALLDKAGYQDMHTAQATVRLSEMYAPTIGALEAVYGAGVGRHTLTIGYGWVVVPTASGPLSMGDGSGGTFFARIGILPDLDAAFVATTSTGGGARAIGEALDRAMGMRLPGSS